MTIRRAKPVIPRSLSFNYITDKRNRDWSTFIASSCLQLLSQTRRVDKALETNVENDKFFFTKGFSLCRNNRSSRSKARSHCSLHILCESMWSKGNNKSCPFGHIQPMAISRFLGRQFLFDRAKRKYTGSCTNRVTKGALRR